MMAQGRDRPLGWQDGLALLHAACGPMAVHTWSSLLLDSIFYTAVSKKKRARNTIMSFLWTVKFTKVKFNLCLQYSVLLVIYLTYHLKMCARKAHGEAFLMHLQF